MELLHVRINLCPQPQKSYYPVAATKPNIIVNKVLNFSIEAILTGTSYKFWQWCKYKLQETYIFTFMCILHQCSNTFVSWLSRFSFSSLRLVSSEAIIMIFFSNSAIVSWSLKLNFSSLLNTYELTKEVISRLQISFRLREVIICGVASFTFSNSSNRADVALNT